MIEAFILGLVQSITEFLPVSSSGHLRIAGYFLNFQEGDSLSFEVALHFGTFLATCVIFFKDIKNTIISFITKMPTYKTSIKDDEYFRMSIMIIIASIPTAIAGLILAKHLASIPLQRIGLNLIMTGSMLVLTRKIDNKNLENKKDVLTTSLYYALLIGIAQSISIFPGISRSGATISIALFLGCKREFAGRFSFLISLPAIFGATLLMFKDITELNMGVALIGFITAFVFGIIALKFLLNFLKNGKLFYFGFYAIIVGIATSIYFSGGG